MAAAAAVAAAAAAAVVAAEAAEAAEAMDFTPGGVLTSVPLAEHHILHWESAHLRTLGGALSRLATTETLGWAATTTLKHTFFASLMAAVAIPGTIMKATSLLDNPWSCAHERAKKGGIALATQVLLPRAHGRRPVVLVGFSLGARLVFECLEELAKELDGGRADAAGIVQHVVLLGLPGPSDGERWARLRRVVAGRVVNCYRPTDLVLSLVYRTSSLAVDAVAGLAPVRCDGVENVDVSDVVSAHHRYRFCVGEILQRLDLEGDGEVSANGMERS